MILKRMNERTSNLGEIEVKEYIPGVILSVIGFILLMGINFQIYGGVMNLNVLILCLFLHVLLFKLFLIERRWVMYSVFITLAPILLFLSLPDLTQQQAMDKAVAMHQMDIKETSRVLTAGGNDWNPFTPSEAYYFKGIAEGKELSVIVIPDTGRVFVVEE